MAIAYHEKLPDELAKIIMVEKYQSNLTYYLINDTEGTYITAYDKETGEHVDTMDSADGIKDDYELSVEEFSMIEDMLQEKDGEEDYTAHGAIKWVSVLVIASYAMVALMLFALMCVIGKFCM